MRCLVALVCLAGIAHADVPTTARPGLAFGSYLELVARGNIELAAQRAGVSVTEAQIAIAKIFPDPQLTASVLSVDASGTGSPTIFGVSVSQTIELGGKRGARIAATRDDLSAARATLEDFLRTLRGESTDAFVDALARRLVLDRKVQTLASLERLVAVNEQRLKAGDIGEIALIQSRVEARKFQGEVLSARADLREAELALALKIGFLPNVEQITPLGELRVQTRAFKIDELIERAKQQRPDVRARRFAVDAARSRIRLAHANRWTDLTLTLGWDHSLVPSGIFEQIAPAPSFDALSASISLPLPFSRVYKGELTGAQFTETVNEWQLRSAELHVEVEIRQAAAKYDAAVERVQLYNSGLLRDAERVLEAKLYSYQRGDIPLLEVLEAQRTVNDVYLAYFDALADHAHSLVALEQAAGIWDIQF